jgi:hypothetical protein
VKVSLPKLEDLIRQVTEYNGFTLDYVRVSDANRLLEECHRLQAELARFNLRWQHTPPEIGDTKWVKVAWNGTTTDCGGEA